MANLAPAGTDRTVEFVFEDAISYNFVPAVFGFSDPDGNSLAGVKITTLPSRGSLQFNGIPVTAGQTVSTGTVSQLKFKPAANENGAPYTQFTFQVQDDGGTTGGGVDLDPTPNTFTFNVVAVNDPPAGIDRTVALSTDANYTFVPSDFPFTDPNDSPVNTLAGVLIHTLPLPTSGVLSLSGLPVVPGTIISLANLAADQFRYSPPVSGNGSFSFTFRVRDAGGTVNGGLDTDPSPNTFTFDVSSAINRAPAGADTTLSLAEDQAYNFALADFGFADLDENGFAAVQIATLPAAGQLTFNSVAVTQNQVIPTAGIGQLVYKPPLNTSGNNLASLTFQVKDNGGTLSSGQDTDLSPNTFIFNVLPVNDPPVTSDSSVTTEQSTSVNVPLAASDSEADLLTYSVVAAPKNGTLSGNAPALIYTPNVGFIGQDSFTFKANDGHADSNISTVTIDVILHVPAETGAQSVPGLAQALFPGFPAGGSPGVKFIVQNDSVELFAVQPTIDSTGKLTFTPAPNSQGTATVTVVKKNVVVGVAFEGEGEEEPADETAEFLIEIVQQAPWQNDIDPNDVDNQDGVNPNDVLLTIDYINGVGSGAISNTSSKGPFYDSDGDNSISPNDVLKVINWINAQDAGVEGEAGTGTVTAGWKPVPRAEDMVSRQLALRDSGRAQEVDWLNCLASDVAGQAADGAGKVKRGAV